MKKKKKRHYYHKGNFSYPERMDTPIEVMMVTKKDHLSDRKMEFLEYLNLCFKRGMTKENWDEDLGNILQIMLPGQAANSIVLELIEIKEYHPGDRIPFDKIESESVKKLIMRKKNYLNQNEWYRKEYCNGDVLVQFLRPELNVKLAFNEYKLIIYLCGDRIFIHDDNIEKVLNIMNKLEPDVWGLSDYEEMEACLVTNKVKTKLDFFNDQTVELIAHWMLSTNKNKRG